MSNAANKNGNPEACAQCAKATRDHKKFCGLMGAEFEYYVLDCYYCGKTIVDRFGRCCAQNCHEGHGGRWQLTFVKVGVLLKVFDPVTGESLVDKNE